MEDCRKEFPIYHNHPALIYLDNSATTLKPKVVVEAMNSYYYEYGVNIHRGLYDLSIKATNAYEETRKNVASFINAKPQEIIFTLNTTDSLNMLAIMLSSKLNREDEVLTTELEHHSSLLPWLKLASEEKCTLKYVKLTKDAKITFNNVKKSITSKTKIIAITYISNVLGYLSPLKEIIDYAHENGIIVIVDAAQAIAHIPIDVKDLDCDFLAFSGHKMFGPTGIGVLYGRSFLLKHLQPVKYGGDMNDDVSLDKVEIKQIPFRFEAGTPMIAEAIGLSTAINFIKKITYKEIIKHEKKLSILLLQELSKFPFIEIYNKKPNIGIISFNFKGLHPHDAATYFASKNIALRAGYHCAQLVANFFKHKGSLRVSLSIYNTEEDINLFIKTVQEVYEYFKPLMEGPYES